MKAIYLIGFMGAGKTSVSRKLAEALSVPHYDTDQEIIKAAGISISDIFASEGEERFREMESEVLKMMPHHDAVIATGGGIVLAEKNRSYMESNGTVIFLYADIIAILQRLEGDNSRPLLKNEKLNAAKSLYRTRLPIYRQTAHLEIDTTSKAVSEIVKEIVVSMK
jgi:shikimate kinase